MSKNITVAEFLAKAIDLSGKTQREVAEEVGYTKPNVVSMMKMGQTKIPIDKVPLFAKACGVDPALFLRMTLQEYFPATWQAIYDHLGDVVTDDERAIIIAYREAAPEGLDPKSPQLDRVINAVKTAAGDAIAA